MKDLEQKVQDLSVKGTILDEMDELKDDEIFKAHSDEIKKLAKEMGSLKIARAWFISQNYERLVEESKKKAVEEFKRQSKKGVLSSNEGKTPSESLDFTKEEEEWARRRVAQKHYKSLKEAWEYLRGKK